MKPEIEEFAQLLVRSVRDRAIRSSDVQSRPDVEGPIAKRWKAAGVEKADVVIPDCVDGAVFFLLEAIDQGAIRLTFKSSSGTLVDLTQEGLGEMAGWYMGSGGWRAQYSSERLVDDFADLA
jgi:hypothetical protein